MKPTWSNSPQLVRYHRIATFNKQRGFTAHGSPRRRRASLTEEERQQYNAEKFRNRARRLAAQGLTSRGTKPKRKNPHLSAPAITYTALKEEIARQPAVLPIATGFRDDSRKIVNVSGSSRGFMTNLSIRGTNKVKEAA